MKTIQTQNRAPRTNCLQTGEPTKHGALFAGMAERQAFQEKVQADIEDLKAQGFEQDAETPNLFRKNGIGITLEAYRVRRTQTMVQHEALSERAIADTAGS